MAIEGVNSETPVEGAEPKPGTGSPATPDPKTVVTPEPKPGTKDQDVETVRRGMLADVQKERQARQKAETTIATLQKQLEDTTKRVQALAGVVPQDEAAEEAAIITERLHKLVPGLKMLGDEAGLKKLERLINSAESLEDMVRQQHTRQGLNTFKSIEAAISKEYGELTERQIKKIRSAYVFEVETNEAFARQHGEDPEANVASFAKEWLEDFFEPAKRRTIASEVNRQRKVPGARERSIVAGPGEKKVDVNNNDQVMDTLVSGFKERGGEFGRRR